jgi:malate dehydrogenase
LSAYEQKAMNDMLPTLKADIALGEEFVNKA